MSRFADPRVTEKLTLGPCACPGTPHEEDWLLLRTELGADDTLRIAMGSSLDAMEVLLVDWNLLDNDGSKAAVDREHISRLYADNFDALNDFTTKYARMSTLPKASAEPSADSSRGNGSRPLTGTRVG